MKIKLDLYTLSSLGPAYKSICYRDSFKVWQFINNWLQSMPPLVNDSNHYVLPLIPIITLFLLVCYSMIYNINFSLFIICSFRFHSNVFLLFKVIYYLLAKALLFHLLISWSIGHSLKYDISKFYHYTHG